ncbi:MAG: hypothetical protein ABID87_03290, partial [Chloroflexota bacterium]
PRFVIDYFRMQEEILKLRAKLAEYEKGSSGEVEIMIRDITREEATKEIRQLFKSGRTLYYSDIANELSLDLEMVVNICQELQEKKEIGIDENALAKS